MHLSPRRAAHRGVGGTGESREVESAQQGLASRQAEYVRCQEERIRDADVDPTPSFGPCQGAELLARSFEQTYTLAIAKAREAFADLATAVQTVERRCEVPLAALAPARRLPPTPACVGFLRSRPGAPLEALRVVCETELSEEECATCVGRR